MYLLYLICAALATVLVLVWLFLFLRYRSRYDSILDKADPKIFTLKELYFTGLGLIEIHERIKRKKITTSEKAVEKIRELSEVFGRNQAELYYYISISAIISLLVTFLPIGLMLPCLMQKPIMLLLGLLLAGTMPYGIYSGINNAIANKKDELRSEFPNMVSKLTLLINAGMIPTRAWRAVANGNTTNRLYEEMRTATRDIEEGMTTERAMDAFALRCGLKEIRKFSSIYVQAVKGGAGEAIGSMKQMADEAWEEKKQFAKQKGEMAAQKLLVPNMLMFIGILIVVVVPLAINMMGGMDI
ncbi:MAG: type II secretion system F family protein [Oscillospiraceae bacterium]|nr:type II secretion system F family protein [Oscillospiraceae bacterium]